MISKYRQLFTSLNVSNVKGFKAPHKAVLLLGLLEQFEHDLLAENRIIIDFGQNFAGWAKINVPSLYLAKGDTLRIRYAERLIGRDTLYTDNLRNAESTDYYISNGEDNDWWAPRFVTHGGRYVELSILSGPSPRSPLKGI